MVVGSGANSYHPDRAKIGTRNWQRWEIEKAAEEGHRFIAVNIDSSYVWPEPLLGKGTTRANSYKVDSIVRAINAA